MGSLRGSKVHASRQPSGEKARNPGVDLIRLVGGLRSDSLSRVVESQISTLSPKQAAMDWPHGDQITSWTSVSTPTLAMHESHEEGRPDTTLNTGEWIYCLYSFRTIDD